MAHALTDLEADAAWFWRREAYHAGRAAFEREFNQDEAAARRHDLRSAAFRACALKADADLTAAEAEADRISSNGFVVVFGGVSVRIERAA